MARVVGAVAALWVVGNAAFAYLALGGERTYRVESACLLFAVVLAGLAVSDLCAGRSPIAEPPFGQDPSPPAAVWGIGLAAWVAVMWVAPGYPLLSDDWVFLERYAEWRALGVTVPGGFYRPVFALVFWMLSPQAWALHAAAGGLHLASVELVRRLVHRAFAPRVAWVAALLFLLSPLQLEAVLWVSGLQELLWTFFALSALLVYSRSPLLTPNALAATLALAGLALGSKETAVCVPILLVAVDWGLFRLKRGRLLPVMYVLLFAQLLLYLAMRARFVDFDRGYFSAPTLYLVKQFVANPYRILAQPWTAAFGRMPGLVPFACTSVVVFLIYWSAIWRRAWIGSLVAVFTVLVSTLPLYRYFYVGENLEAARYLYFASIGWSLFVATSLDGLFRTRRAFGVAATALMCLSATLLAFNLRPWNTAASVVQSMEEALGRGEDPAVNARQWAAQHGAPIHFEEGVPQDVQGVNIFLNGYPEFQRLAARQRK